MKNLIPLCLTAAIVLLTTGCSTRSNVTANTATTGQELIDLEKALRSELITQKQYDKKKKEILKR